MTERAPPHNCSCEVCGREPDALKTVQFGEFSVRLPEERRPVCIVDFWKNDDRRVRTMGLEPDMNQCMDIYALIDSPTVGGLSQKLLDAWRLAVALGETHPEFDVSIGLEYVGTPKPTITMRPR